MPAAPRGGTSRQVLIDRYTAVVLAQPTTPFPLQRLAQLYRERDGNADKLVADFERRAAEDGPTRYAARLVLAGLYVQDGHASRADALLRDAIAERPKDPAPRLSLGQLQKDQGESALARQTYEEALALLPNGQDRENTLRTLVALGLDAKDFDGAKRHHRELVRASQNSIFVRSELARELMSRDEFEKAEAELRELVTAASGDHRTLAPALRDLGRALARQGKQEEAIATFRRALSAASADSGLRNEILQLLAQVYREGSNLPAFIQQLEAEHPGDRERLTLLGALYEETGSVDQALAVYRRAVAAAPRNLDLRLKVVHLLQARGDLEEATREYEMVLRIAPRNADYVFELCETLVQRGERARAMARLAELEARASGDEETLVRLADFYDKLDEKQKAIGLLARLSAVAPGDPRHLADLGDRYFQQGDKKKALEIWARIKVVVPHRAKALATLGEVYLEHDMPVEALECLREATQLEPQNLAYVKAYAGALERSATSTGASALANVRYEEARGLWERLLEKAGADPNLAREARAHIVTLWSLLRQLEPHVKPLEQRMAASPPDVNAGRLLAEVQTRLHRLSEAESTLRTVCRITPGDAESWLALERLLVQAHNLEGAIAVLQKLVQIDPKRAREFYQRMAQYAAELYHDDDAIAYAARAVQLSPDDADGHRRLGQMFQKKQDVARAIQEYRAAIQKNDKLFPVYFELAQLLLSRGDVDEGDQLLRRIVRTAADDELVAQAARQSMQINLGRGALETLERDLLPLAIGKPRKTVYRRLLVDLYGALAFPLMQQAQAGLPAEAEAARAELRAIGMRAVKPLLDALVDDKAAQQRIAVDLLAFVENKSAGAALFAFATGSAEQGLRTRAMLACGALRDSALLPKYQDFLFPKGDPILSTSDPLSVTAAWSVARLGDAKAQPLLDQLLRRGSPDIRALAAIGLGLLHDRRSIPELARIAASADAGNLVRAAAAFALGALDARESQPVLIALARQSDRLPRQAAVLALARQHAPAAAELVADALVDPDSTVRESAAMAASVLATGRYEGRADPLPVPTGSLDLRRIVSELVPAGYSAEDRAAALVHLAPSLERALKGALETSPERARVIADALLAHPGRASLAPLTDGLETVPIEARRPAEAAAERLAAAAVPGFVELERHPSAALRIRAVQFLATREEESAQRALMDALQDRDPSVRQAAISAIGPRAGEPVVKSLVKVLSSDDAWTLRIHAAEALGRVGRAGGPMAAAALEAAARKDPYALVREAALVAWAAASPSGTSAVLHDAAEHDAEDRVRATARTLLERR